MALRTNYKDDVFNGNRKYNMTTNGDGTVSFTDETEYSQVGDSYGAAQINEANEKINDLDTQAYRLSDGVVTELTGGDQIPVAKMTAAGKSKISFSNFVNALKSSLAIKVHDSTSAGTYGAGNGSKFGHVKLSDKYTSSDGAASNSVGASSYALSTAYSTLNSALSSTNSTVSTLSTTVTNNYNTLSRSINSLSTTVTNNYNTLNGKINTTNTNLSNLSGDVSSIGRQVNTNTQNINYLNDTTVPTINNNIDSLSSRINNNYNDFVGEFTAAGVRLYMDYKKAGYGINAFSDRRDAGFLGFLQSNTINILFPNLVPCLRIFRDLFPNYAGQTGAQPRIAIGQWRTAIPASVGTTGSSARPSDYHNINEWKTNYGYVPVEETGKSYTFNGFPNPSFQVNSPYCDIQCYNVGDDRYYVLYIASIINVYQGGTY